MFKKVISIVIMLCLISAISVGAQNGALHESGQDAGGQMQGGWGNMPPMGEMPSGEFAPPEGFTQPTGETAPTRTDDGNEQSAAPGTDSAENGENQQNPENAGQMQGGNFPFGGRMPEGMGGFPGNMQNAQNTEAEQPAGFWGFVRTYSTPLISIVLLVLAFIFVGLSSCVSIRTRFFLRFFRHYFVEILANASALAAFSPHTDEKI